MRGLRENSCAALPVTDCMAPGLHGCLTGIKTLVYSMKPWYTDMIETNFLQ